jgi:hypothetical protein
LTATSAAYAYSFNTNTLVTTAITATYALTATSAAYAYAFNTTTLVLQATTATYALTATSAAYAYAFNTGTLVTTATYALSFNTSTLVAHSVLADTATIAGSLVGGVVSSIIAGTGTFISTSSGAVTVWISTASTFSGGNVVNSTQFTDPTQSINTTTGAVTISGGLGVGGNINAGGRVGIGITATTYLLDINDTQTTGTGIRVQGGSNGGPLAIFSRTGVGAVQINVSTGNPQLTFTRAASPTWELGVDATQFVISNGIAGSIDNPVTTDFLTIANTSGVVTIISTTAAISTTTGALKVAGGMGVGGDAYHGGSMYIAGATHYTTGSNTSVVYQYYNTLTNSLDTVFG